MGELQGYVAAVSARGRSLGQWLGSSRRAFFRGRLRILLRQLPLGSAPIIYHMSVARDGQRFRETPSPNISTVL